VHAAGNGPSPATLDPVVVTATRVGQSPFEIPASIDSIAAGEIEAGVPGVNLSEVLSGIAGVLVRDRQNYAQDQQISIRGFGTRAPFGIVGSRLYLDGVPASQPDGQGQVSHFNLDTAVRIEVLRGPFSALYGNAAGGVIQMFTGEGTQPPQFSLETAGGSYGTVRASLNARGAGEGWDYNAGFTHFETDGYRGHSSARRESGNARASLQLGGGRRLTLVANTVSIPDAQDPLGVNRAQFESNPRGATPQAEQFNARKSVSQSQLGVIAEQAIGASQSLQLVTYYGGRKVEQYLAIPVMPQANPLHSGGVVDLDNRYYGGDLRWILRSHLLERPFSLVAGLAYDLQDSERRGYENFIGDQLGVKGELRRDEDNEIYDLDQYVQANWDFAEDWAVLAGLRSSVVRFRSDDHYVVGSNGPDSGGAEFDAVTPVAGVLYRAHPRLRLYASYGRGFDTPTFAELAYRPDGDSRLNTDLKPARTHSAELGAKWRFADSGIVNAALFYATTRDEIVIATASGGRTTYQNADARRQGAELSASAALTDALRWAVAYTFVDARFADPYDTCAGTFCPEPTLTVPSDTRVPGVPLTNLYAALRWGRENGWNAALEGRYVSAVPVNSAQSEFAPAYSVFALGGGYVWEIEHLRLRAYARLDNALDRDYAGSVIVNDGNSRYYEPAPGRSVFAGLDLRWKL
jgi:iron complex outermembrane receptor protein